MRWVYLSPHFDDVVFSCGGHVWEQAQLGVEQSVEIWTVCAGGPKVGEPLSAFAQSLHDRWQTGPDAVSIRRFEDEASGQRLGVNLRYWDLPDCIYRPLRSNGWLVNGEADLWVTLPSAEEVTIQRLCQWLRSELQPTDQLVAPLALGNHIDHQLVRTAAERVVHERGCSLWYYADYPYAVRDEAVVSKVAPGWQKSCRPVSEAALAAWQAAIACHTSQISTFWGGLDEMRASIKTYWLTGGGACLWQAHE